MSSRGLGFHRFNKDLAEFDQESPNVPQREYERASRQFPKRQEVLEGGRRQPRTRLNLGPATSARSIYYPTDHRGGTRAGRPAS